MKNYIVEPLITIILFSIVQNSFAQSCIGKTVVGKIDVLSKNDSLCNKCVPKGCYAIQVVNMNPLLYTFNVNTTQVVPVFEKNDNLLEGLITNLGKATADVEKTDSSVKVSGPKNISRSPDNKSAPTADEIREKTCAEFQLKVKEFEAALKEYKLAKKDLKDFLDVCFIIKSVCFSPSLKREKILEVIDDANGPVKKYLNAKGLSAVSSLEFERHATVLSEAYKTSFEKLKSVFTEVKGKYEECRSAEKKASSGGLISARNDDLNKEVADIFKSVEEGVEKFKVSDAVVTAVKSAGFYEEINRPESFTKCIEINCGDIDSIKTEINFYLKSDTAKNKTSIHTAKLDFRVKGGMRHFRSPGLMLNFGGVKDEKFFLNKDSIITQETNRGKGFPSLAYMENFYWRKCGDVSPGFSFGLAANMNNISELTSLRFFLGPSLFIGERARFLISTGVTGGFSERLKGKFDAGTKIDTELYKKEGEKLTDKNWVFGFYLGISYKIF